MRDGDERRVALTPLLGSLVGLPGGDNDGDTTTRTDGKSAGSGGAAPTPRPGAVLGERTPGTGGIPELPLIDRATGEPGVVAILLLCLFVGSLFGLIVATVAHWRHQRV